MFSFPKLASLAVLAAVTCGGAAQAQPAYYADGTPVVVTRQAPAYGARPLVVSGRRYAPAPVVVAPAYDPYAGPQALVTAPIAVASTLVALPFRVVNAIFPAHGDPSQNPLVLVGAPVHAAGQLAQIPFNIMQAPFGGPAPVAY